MQKADNKRDYFIQSGLKEIALLRKHFNIEGHNDGVKVVREVSLNSVRDFFREYIATVRPRKLSEDKILPKPDISKVRALYVGHPDINIILNTVVRHCLYLDQIAIIDPLMTLPIDDVLSRPQAWVEVVINRALCLCALEEWVRQELVLILPDIRLYYPQIQESISSMPELFTPTYTLQQSEFFQKRTLVRLLVSQPKESRQSLLKVLSETYSGFDQINTDLLLEEVEDFESKYPIRFRLSQDSYDRYFKGVDRRYQVVDFSYGAPLLLTPFLAQEIGGFLIFEHPYLYDLVVSKQSSSSVKSEAFQQLAIAFQGLDFTFLHNVSLKQALAIRKRGYLHSFRQYLRDLWSTISQLEENDRFEDKTFDFTERLKAEFEILEKEWKDIRREFRFKAVTSGLTVGLSTAASAIAVGNVSVAVVAGLTSGLLKETVNGYSGVSGKLKEIQRRPLSVFLLLND